MGESESACRKRSLMRAKCPRCGEELVTQPSRVFRIGIPWLNKLFQVETPHKCPHCDTEVRTNIQTFDNGLPSAPLVSPKHLRDTEPTLLHWYQQPFLAFHGVVRSSDRVFLPTSEGRIGRGDVIDRFGDPDLMAEIAKEYLRQFWALLPDGRFPGSLQELLPPLLLLMTSTEQALKAFWIRSGRTTREHSLPVLYAGLAQTHRWETERFFADSQIMSILAEHGADKPTIDSILNTYTHTHDSGGVYVDARYFAEPTTMLPKSSNLHGANLSKSLTPYPIFLPAVAQALLDAYVWTSGVERLRRRGADLERDAHDQGTGSHGEYGLVPASLGLVAIAFPQSVALDSSLAETAAFKDFKLKHPTRLQADWMYGGSRILLYQDDHGQWRDQDQAIDGLQCRVWSRGRLGMHTRDLNRLADILEDSDAGAHGFGILVASTESTES